MNKRDALSQLFAGLAPALKPHGFKASRKDACFVRPTEHGSHWILVEVLDYAPLQRVRFHLGIRLDVVEDIFHQHSGTLPAFRSRSLTCCTRFAYLAPDIPDWYEVSDSDQAAAVARAIGDVYAEGGEAFFDAYTTPGGLSDRLREAPAGFNTIISPYAQMKRLILAKLTGTGDLRELSDAAFRECLGLHEMDVSKLRSLAGALLDAPP